MSEVLLGYALHNFFEIGFLSESEAQQFGRGLATNSW